MSPCVVSGDRPVLESITGDTEWFLPEVFGRRPWRFDQRQLVGLLGVDDIDTIVASAIRVPAIRMMRDGERIAPERFCTPTRLGNTTLNDVADIGKVLDLVRNGATLILQSLHRTWGPVSRWCADLEDELGWPVQANAYLTPAGERGLAPHSDGHDVFALQLHGAKTWQVDDLGACDLREGDVLYLPAGTEHCARAGDMPSLHLTVGVHRPTPERLARAVSTIAVERLGSRWAAMADPRTALGQWRETLDAVTVDDVLDHLRRRPRRHLGGLLASSITRAPVTLRTSLTPSGPWTITEVDADGRIGLTWPDGVLALPARTRPAIALLACGPVTVDALAGLTPAEQLVLARRLLDERAARLVD